jgi:hypothetical protein
MSAKHVDRKVTARDKSCHSGARKKGHKITFQWQKFEEQHLDPIKYHHGYQ